LPVVAIEQPPAGARVAIGAGGDRTAYGAALAAHGWQPATVVHPLAFASPRAALGSCVVGPAAVIGADTRVGDHVLVGRGALIGHHVDVAPAVVINPGANVAGHARIGAGATIGMGAVVVDHVEVGDGAVVAAGAVVVRPVAAGERVQGVPARAWKPA
jgi:UDP-3-O-[3-hydroxymyristoyl] glucosamine N-acyltransferase